MKGTDALMVASSTVEDKELGKIQGECSFHEKG